MRDELNQVKADKSKSVIINYDHSKNDGTHWVCLYIENGVSYYFDSFGFPPPLEVKNYCPEPRYYNSDEI